MKIGGAQCVQKAEERLAWAAPVLKNSKRDKSLLLIRRMQWPATSRSLPRILHPSHWAVKDDVRSMVHRAYNLSFLLMARGVDVVRARCFTRICLSVVCGDRAWLIPDSRLRLGGSFHWRAAVRVVQ